MATIAERYEALFSSIGSHSGNHSHEKGGADRASLKAV